MKTNKNTLKKIIQEEVGRYIESRGQLDHDKLKKIKQHIALNMSGSRYKAHEIVWDMIEAGKIETKEEFRAIMDSLDAPNFEMANYPRPVGFKYGR